VKHVACLTLRTVSQNKVSLSLSLNHKDYCLSFEWCMRRYEVQEFPVVAIHIFVPCVLHLALPTFTFYLLEYWGARRRCVTQQWRHFQGDTVFIILMKSVLPHAVSRFSFSLWAVDTAAGITKIECFMCRVGFAFSEQLSRCSSMVVQIRLTVSTVLACRTKKFARINCLNARQLSIECAEWQLM
jgi:hypothetical protein